MGRARLGDEEVGVAPGRPPLAPQALAARAAKARLHVRRVRARVRVRVRVRVRERVRVRVRERVRVKVKVRGRASGRLGARAHHAADGLRPVHGEI